jgi:hypothetical protein
MTRVSKDEDRDFTEEERKFIDDMLFILRMPYLLYEVQYHVDEISGIKDLPESCTLKKLRWYIDGAIEEYNELMESGAFGRYGFDKVITLMK